MDSFTKADPIFRRDLFASVLIGLLASVCFSPFAAYAAPATPVAPPPGGTPGGARPQIAAPNLEMPADTGPAFTIPPVFDRPLGTDEGERVFVKSFVLRGVEDDLAAGIKTTEIEKRVQARFDELTKLLEELRVTKQNQENIDADGFTAEERAKILNFIQSVLSTMSTDDQVEAYQSFIQGLRLQRLERDAGLTIGQMQLIANEVTKYYNERGYFLARAIVPAQEVHDGVVTIRVLEGRLGQVVVEGNHRYSEEDIQAPFKDFIGKLITVDRVEEALLSLQAYPGVSATGVFRPGRYVGTADIVVNVQQETISEWLVHVDNHGSRFTGRERLVMDYTWNGPLHDADFLKLQAVQTFNPYNSIYGSVRYEARLDNPDNRWGVSVSNNTFDVADPTTGGSSGVAGVSKDIDLYFTHQLTRTRTDKTSFLTEVVRKQGDTSSSGVVLTSDQEAVLGAQLDTEQINPATSTISSMYLRADRGFPGVLGVPTEDEILNPGTGSTVPQYSRASATGKFFKMQLGYSSLKLLTPTHSLLFRFNAQWTNDRLTSLEQFNLGGVQTVRGAPTSAALRDKGLYTSLEYQFRGLWFADKPAWGGKTYGQVLGFGFFYDYAVGVNNLLPSDPTDITTERLTLMGPGVSMDVTLPWGVTSKVQYSHLNGGVRGDPTNPASITDLNQIWIEIQKTF